MTLIKLKSVLKIIISSKEPQSEINSCKQSVLELMRRKKMNLPSRSFYFGLIMDFTLQLSKSNPYFKPVIMQQIQSWKGLTQIQQVCQKLFSLRKYIPIYKTKKVQWKTPIQRTKTYELTIEEQTQKSVCWWNIKADMEKNANQISQKGIDKILRSAKKTKKIIKP